MYDIQQKVDGTCYYKTMGKIIASGRATNLSGIWRSHYDYKSSSRDGAFENEHYVVISHKGSHVTIKNLPHTSESKIELYLEQDGRVLTGTWKECTSPTGYYKGKVYHGAIQLAINEERTYISGKWLGFGADLEINTGNWNFTRLGKADSAALRAQVKIA